jgi:predicted double-glycine peptidase
MNKKPVYYKQSDPRWSKIPYTIDGDKNETIGASGCGPTCAAMIVATVRDPNITPVEMCELAIELGDRTANSGTEWEFFKKVAAKYGIPFKQTAKTKEAVEALKQGAYVVCSMKPGHFTNNGHFVVAWDVVDNNLMVHDPISTAQNRTYAAISIFEAQCKQYFIFFVNQKAQYPTLKKGMRNDYVRLLQERLNKKGYKIKADGIFGNETDGAVRAYQKSTGLVVDGIVGVKTWGKLFEV